MKVLFSFCCVFITFVGFGQNEGSIKGTVTDAGMNEEPVLFANVQIKNAETTTETNFHGNYEFNGILPGEYTLVISYLGYETTEIPIVVTAKAETNVRTSLKTLLPSFDEFELGDEVSETNIESSHTAAVWPKE
ncbi:carboxypeptidase-like regulatory domain-containing protein [Aggregatimonas sangjinii]|nr:carboxypeptidase-like regulatory domain-containing protein [Aggregatimonas sangjinii]